MWRDREWEVKSNHGAELRYVNGKSFQEVTQTEDLCMLGRLACHPQRLVVRSLCALSAGFIEKQACRNGDGYEERQAGSQGKH